MAMGDRIVVLHKGVVRQIGTPRDVYDDPADTFVATFLGSPPMNLIANGEVVVGFRPEHLVPVERAPSAAIKLSLTIENVEYLGSEWIVYGRTNESKLVIARLPSAAELQIGTTYDFGVVEKHLRFHQDGIKAIFGSHRFGSQLRLVDRIWSVSE